jgi:hypothetical protein
MTEVPAVRSSDYEAVLGCPFGYYLRRRLGLRRKLGWSEALSRGTWFHERARLFWLPESSVPPLMEAAWNKRKAELNALCSDMGIISESRKGVIQREEADYLNAWAWWEAAEEVPISTKLGTLREFLSQPYWRPLAPEPIGAVRDSRWEQTPLVAAWDLLLYHEKHKTVWVVDYKTCRESPQVRLSTCPIEFQTQHYLHVLAELLGLGVLQETFGLPPDTSAGGVMHIAVQKPSIELSGKDRHTTTRTKEITRGPRKGEMVEEEIAHGPPSRELFARRCRDWMRGEGLYSHESARRGADPCVNISFSSPRLLDGSGLEEYHARVNHIHSHATRDPYPNNFLRSATAPRRWRDLDDWAPFYLMEISQWPKVLHEFLVDHRKVKQAEKLKVGEGVLVLPGQASSTSTKTPS